MMILNSRGIHNVRLKNEQIALRYTMLVLYLDCVLYDISSGNICAWSLLKMLAVCCIMSVFRCRWKFRFTSE